MPAGTSLKTLIYHFENRDQLVKQVLQEARRRQHELSDGLLQPLDAVRPAGSLPCQPCCKGDHRSATARAKGTPLVAGELDRADELARRSLAAAEAAGLTGWAAEVPVEALRVVGRLHRTADLDTARAAFERARVIADNAALGAWRIRTLHDLATIDMLADGDATALADVRKLAHEAGLFSIATIIDLQLANFMSLGTDLDQALAAAMRCERGARRIGAHRVEALAISLQALISGIRSDATCAEQAARRAEAILPGDPLVLITTVCRGRVVTALFRDDIARAARFSARADSYRQQILTAPVLASGFYSPAQAPLIGRGFPWGLNALLQAATGVDITAAIELARSAGADVSWNRGCLAYAAAVMAGRSGQPEQAASLAAEGAARFAPYAPWWNHLGRRLVARAAFADNWGQPAEWMREAASSFEATHTQLASACRGILRQAGEKVPRSGRGTASVPPQMRRLGVTSREMDVYLLVAQGLSNAEIADRLFISPKTVETHIASLVAKTRQPGRRELVAHAARHLHP